MNHSSTDLCVSTCTDCHGDRETTSFNTWDLIYIVDKVAIGSVVILFGILSNMVNLLVILRQGFSDAVNVSLFGLTVSDIGGLLSLLWAHVSSNPLLVRFVDLPYAPDEFIVLPSGIRFYFCRTTCYVTIFITIQRCMCIAQPMKIKCMLPPKRTGLVITAIFVATIFLHFFALYCTGVAYIDWAFFPLRNQSLLSFIITDDWETTYNTTILISSVFQITSFVAIILCTAILVYQLKQKSKWRDSTLVVGSDKTKHLSQRDHKLGVMVVLLSATLIVCYIPSTFSLILSLCLPAVRNVSSPDNIFVFFWTVGTLCEAINSSVNIFVYYSVSSKYRSTLDGMCVQCGKCA